MSENDEAVHQPSLTEDTTAVSLDRTNTYPYCSPSYDPTTVDGSRIEKWMNDNSCFGETDCDVYEIEGGQDTWKTNRNDVQMQEYLRVSTTLSNPSHLWKKAC